MWEHRAISNKLFKNSGNMNPTETYVRLMDEVEDNVAEAHRQQFNHHEF